MEVEQIKYFFQSQLKDWPMATKHFFQLRNIRKKEFNLGRLEYILHYNPSRANSTMAKVNKEDILKRDCFLCSRNRPEEQNSIEILKDWELLVNPFPILPYHFTIAHKQHGPQILNIETGKKLAEELTGMIVFYNDSGAGASAPDHSHYQSVPYGELPLVNYLDANRDVKTSELMLPFKVVDELREVQDLTCPVNAYFWRKDDEIRFIAIPRKSHRPKFFYLDPPFRRAVSPGALDMAGIMVTPFEEDFESFKEDDIRTILLEVAYPNE